MSGFVKVYDTILRSSVWLEDGDTRLVWMTMLFLADADGIVRASVGGLAHQARVGLESCRAALAIFSAPDPDDRSGVDDGRRIRPVQGGWLVVNHRHYREMQTPHQVAEAERLRAWRKRRTEDRTRTVREGTYSDVQPKAEAKADPEASGSPEASAYTYVRGTPRAKGARTMNGHETVLTAYRTAYRARYGREPAITAADRSQVGRLLNGARPADVPPADWPIRLAELATAYVRDHESFVTKAGHPLRLLPTRLAALASGPTPPRCRRCKKPLVGGSIEGYHRECYR